MVEFVDEVINNYEDESILESVKEKVNAMMAGKPLFV